MKVTEKNELMLLMDVLGEEEECSIALESQSIDNIEELWKENMMLRKKLRDLCDATSK